jgi:hypothetical protein
MIGANTIPHLHEGAAILVITPSYISSYLAQYVSSWEDPPPPLPVLLLRVATFGLNEDYFFFL